MNARTRLIFVGKLALLVGALGVTYGLTAYAGLQLSLKSREVSAPDLRGLTPAEATEALVAVGLNARIESLRRYGLFRWFLLLLDPQWFARPLKFDHRLGR